MSDDGPYAVVYLFGNELTCAAENHGQRGQFSSCGWITPTIGDGLSFASDSIALIIVLGYTYHLWLEKKRADAGEMDAMDRLVLPVYYYIIMIFAIVTAASVAFDLLDLATWITEDDDDGLFGIRIVTLLVFGRSVDKASHRFLIDGITLFFVHPGAGWETLKKVLAMSLLWSVFTFSWAFVYYTYFYVYERCSCLDYQPATNTLQGSIVGGNLLIISLYVVVVTCFTVRPAARTWVKFELTCLIVIEGLRCIEIVLQGFPGCWLELSDVDKEEHHAVEQAANTVCACTTVAKVVEIVLTPIMILNAMVKDSSFWQGEFFSRYGDEGDADGALYAPLDGSVLRSDAAEALARSMQQYSMVGPRFGGLVIHFGQLKIGSMIGRGSYSKVFRGTMTRSKMRSCAVPVAVKMMWCIDITVDDIQMFAHEVRMLKSLSSHHTVVSMHGISIMPPALCIVMELCEMGSLRDLLNESEELAQREGLTPGNSSNTSRDGAGAGASNTSMGSASAGGSIGARASKVEVLRMLLTWGARLDVARQCAEAVWYLHSRNPPLLHQDLKSANFLVTQRLDDGEYYRRNVGVPGAGPDAAGDGAATPGASGHSVRSTSGTGALNESGRMSVGATGGGTAREGFENRCGLRVKLSDLGSALDEVVNMYSNHTGLSRSSRFYTGSTGTTRASSAAMSLPHGLDLQTVPSDIERGGSNPLVEPLVIRKSDGRSSGNAGAPASRDSGRPSQIQRLSMQDLYNETGIGQQPWSPPSNLSYLQEDGDGANVHKPLVSRATTGSDANSEPGSRVGSMEQHEGNVSQEKRARSSSSSPCREPSMAAAANLQSGVNTGWGDRYFGGGPTYGQVSGLHRNRAPTENSELSGSNVSRVSHRRRSKYSVAFPGLSLPGITPNWTAPEIIEGRAGPSTNSDLYSLGLVLWEVFTFKEPFPTLNAREIAVAVCEHDVRPPIPPSVPSPYAKLVQQLWSKHAQDRPNAELVINTIVGFSKRVLATERQQMVMSGNERIKSQSSSELSLSQDRSL